MLPKIDKKLVAKVKADMNSKGYSLVDTSKFISKQNWPHEIPNDSGEMYYFEVSDPRLVRWMKRFLQWQTKLLQSALPTENIRLLGNSTSIRNEKEKEKDRSIERWHTDGYYIRSICVNNGDTTEYLTKSKCIKKLPKRWLLFMTCQRARYTKIPATVHRRPATKKARSLVVTGWHGNVAVPGKP
jgi:hypothetical protein